MLKLTPQLCTMAIGFWLVVVSGIVVSTTATEDAPRSAMGTPGTPGTPEDKAEPTEVETPKPDVGQKPPGGMKITRLEPPEGVDRGGDQWDLVKSDPLKPGATSCRRNHMMEYLKLDEGYDLPEQCVNLMLYWGRNQPAESVLRAVRLGKSLSLPKYQGVKDVSLSRNFFQDPGGVPFSKMLETNTGLEKLTLDDNELTDNTLMGIANALLANKGSSLNMLSLARNKIGTRHGIKMLSSVLRTSHTLRAIDLASNELNDADVELLIGAMECNAVVTTLNIPYQKNGGVSPHLEKRLIQLVSANSDRPSKKAKIVKCKADGNAVVTAIGVVAPKDEL